MTDNDTSPPPKITDAPAAIWLVYGDIERDCTHQECNRNGDVGWCDDKQFDSDVEYVRSDTIEAQAERIRVLREALERLDGQCHGEREVSAVFVRKVCRAALDATK